MTKKFNLVSSFSAQRLFVFSLSALMALSLTAQSSFADFNAFVEALSGSSGGFNANSEVANNALLRNTLKYVAEKRKAEALEGQIKRLQGDIDFYEGAQAQVSAKNPTKLLNRRIFKSTEQKIIEARLASLKAQLAIKQRQALSPALVTAEREAMREYEHLIHRSDDNMEVVEQVLNDLAARHVQRTRGGAGYGGAPVIGGYRPGFNNGGYMGPVANPVPGYQGGAANLVPGYQGGAANPAPAYGSTAHKASVFNAGTFNELAKLLNHEDPVVRTNAHNAIALNEMATHDPANAPEYYRQASFSNQAALQAAKAIQSGDPEQADFWRHVGGVAVQRSAPQIEQNMAAIKANPNIDPKAKAGIEALLPGTSMSPQAKLGSANPTTSGNGASLAETLTQATADESVKDSTTASPAGRSGKTRANTAVAATTETVSSPKKIATADTTSTGSPVIERRRVTPADLKNLPYTNVGIDLKEEGDKAGEKLEVRMDRAGVQQFKVANTELQKKILDEKIKLIENGTDGEIKKLEKLRGRAKTVSDKDKFDLEIEKLKADADAYRKEMKRLDAVVAKDAKYRDDLDNKRLELEQRKELFTRRGLVPDDYKSKVNKLSKKRIDKEIAKLNTAINTAINGSKDPGEIDEARKKLAKSVKSKLELEAKIKAANISLTEHGKRISEIESELRKDLTASEKRLLTAELKILEKEARILQGNRSKADSINGMERNLQDLEKQTKKATEDYVKVAEKNGAKDIIKLKAQVAYLERLKKAKSKAKDEDDEEFELDELSKEAVAWINEINALAKYIRDPLRNEVPNFEIKKGAGVKPVTDISTIRERIAKLSEKVENDGSVNTRLDKNQEGLMFDGADDDGAKLYLQQKRSRSGTAK